MKLRPHERPKDHGVYPLSADVDRHVRRVAKAHPDLVKVKRVIRSVQGRPIWAVTVTDPKVSSVDKQHALVVGGQHGNEESGRAVALALIDWLTTKAAAETRRKQTVVVMPNISPDACERDQYINVKGVNPNRDHAVSGPTSPEGEALEIVARRLRPELFIDLHACGGAGCGVDIVLYPDGRRWTEDEWVLRHMADDMTAAGERAGIPQQTFPLSWWGVTDISSNSSSVYLYRNFKTLELLTENTESNTHTWTLRDRVRAGLAKVKAALRWGNRRFPKLYYPGYPTMLAAGQFVRGVMSVGKTAAARRQSRVDIWRNVAKFDGLGLANPQEAKRQRLTLKYSGARLRRGVGVQLAARGRLRVKSATLNGRRLKRSETSGYTTWHHGAATYTVVVVRDLRRGKHEIEIVYA
ncbi:MAG TPA: M14 family zinc carboxypeptidase [Planctomycetota bacterium]|nr:M14 family zinc carboxypeptidase [Planctomycetota bacterium]